VTEGAFGTGFVSQKPTASGQDLRSHGARTGTGREPGRTGTGPDGNRAGRGGSEGWGRGAGGLAAVALHGPIGAGELAWAAAGGGRVMVSHHQTVTQRTLTIRESAS
jgi:hypothetical protein